MLRIFLAWQILLKNLPCTCPFGQNVLKHKVLKCNLPKVMIQLNLLSLEAQKFCDGINLNFPHPSSCSMNIKPQRGFYKGSNQYFCPYKNRFPLKINNCESF